MTEVLLEDFCQGDNVVDPALIFFLREFAFSPPGNIQVVIPVILGLYVAVFVAVWLKPTWLFKLSHTAKP